jgi:hypothetical protein
VSDQVAVVALAARLGRDLDTEGVAVVPMGGATNIGAYLERYRATTSVDRFAGLCDVREESSFRRGLQRAGLGNDLDRGAMESLGFFVCVEDLEDELIRSLGIATVEQLIEAQGELGSLQTFRKQAVQQTRTPQQQLRRFMGTRSGRKIHYARVLVDALDLTRVPRPLEGLLAHL